MINESIQCIVCASSARNCTTLSADQIVLSMRKYFRNDIPDGLGLIDYDIYRCDSCGLEFSYPMVSGSENFYNWITAQDKYYPEVRWEWEFVSKLINTPPENDIKVLEVGCGSGKFLESVAKNSNIRCVGLDPSVNSIEASILPNLKIYRTTLAGFESEYPYELGSFDYVVAFHTLEHLSDPLLFMKELRRFTKPEGKILISTPLSPMTFEYNWHDPLNYPPHHLTRWNLSSYDMLANKIDMKASFIFPRGTKFFRVIQNIFIIELFGVGSQPSKWCFVKRSIFRIDLLIKSICNILRRGFASGKLLDDSVLVIFKK